MPACIWSRLLSPSGLAKSPSRYKLPAMPPKVDTSHRSFTSLRSKAPPPTSTTPNSTLHASMAASSLVPPGMTSFIDSLPIRPPSLQTTTTSSSAKFNACFVEGPFTSKSKRQDEPPSHCARRGSKRLALPIAGNLQLLEEAEAAYRRDWVSAGDTSGYYLITWMEPHAAYGHTKMLDD